MGEQGTGEPHAMWVQSVSNALLPDFLISGPPAQEWLGMLAMLQQSPIAASCCWLPAPIAVLCALGQVAASMHQVCCGHVAVL